MEGQPINTDNSAVKPQDSTLSEAADNPPEKTDYEKLKERNDNFDKELIRGRELEAEAQKLKANEMLAGTAGGHIEPEVIDPKEKAKAYGESIMKGRIPNDK